MSLEKIRLDNEKKIESCEVRKVRIQNRLLHEKLMLQKYAERLSRIFDVNPPEDPEARDAHMAKREWIERRLFNKEELIKCLEKQIRECEDLIELYRAELLELSTTDLFDDQYKLVERDFQRAEEGEWKIRNSRFKTFQDLFSPSKYRVLPREEGLFSEMDYDQIPLDACVIDPEKIPCWLISDFRLNDPQKLKDARTPLEKLKYKMESTDGLRYLFATLQPIKPFTYSEKFDSYRILTLQGYHPDHDGKLFCPRHLGTQEPQKDRKFLQVFDSAYTAYRKSVHPEVYYKKEKERLFQIKTRISSNKTAMIGMKKDDFRRGEILREIAMDIESLEGMTHYLKREASDILKRVRELKDSLGRHNPGAVCAQLLVAIKDLEERLPQVLEISKAMHADKEVLSMVIREGEAALDRSYLQFKSMCDELILFERRQKQGTLFCGSKEFKEMMLSMLRSLPDFRSFRVRPFNAYAKRLENKLQMIEFALQNGEMDVLKDTLVKAFIITKIFKIEQHREEILRKISLSPSETTIEDLNILTSELYGVVKKRQVYPLFTTSYEIIYKKIEEDVRKLNRGLEVYSRTDLDPFQKVQMFERLKKFLSDLDFVDFLRQLDFYNGNH